MNTIRPPPYRLASSRGLNSTRTTAQAGNALFLILIAVALFAALSYAVTTSSRGSGSIEKEQSVIYAAQITEFGATLRSAITRTVLSGTDLSDLRFAHADLHADYGTPGTDPGNEVFHPSGGGVSYRDAPAGSQTAGEAWLFNGSNAVVDIGCNWSGIECRDLIAILPNITKDICLQINRQLGVQNPSGDPPLEPGAYGTTKFKGTFLSQNRIDVLTGGEPFACFESEDFGGYNYMHVLVER